MTVGDVVVWCFLSAEGGSVLTLGLVLACLLPKPGDKPYGR